MSLARNVLDKLKEHFATVLVAGVAAGVFSAWNWLEARIDDHIEVAVAARLNNPDSELAKSIAGLLVKSSNEARSSEAGAITAGTAVLSTDQPSFTFVLFLPKENHANLYVSIDWTVIQEGSSVLLQADQSAIRRFNDEGTFEIPNFDAILRNSTKAEANNTDLDPSLIELVPPIQGHMADAHAITFQLTGWRPGQAAEVKIKYLAITTPFIRLEAEQ